MTTLSSYFQKFGVIYFNLRYTDELLAWSLPVDRQFAKSFSKNVTSIPLHKMNRFGDIFNLIFEISKKTGTISAVKVLDHSKKIARNIKYVDFRFDLRQKCKMTLKNTNKFRVQNIYIPSAPFLAILHRGCFHKFSIEWDHKEVRIE